MNYRKLGKTGFNVSEISLGTWQVGGKWGESFNEKNAEEIVNEAIDGGVNFIDTADVYSDGLSEKAVGRVVRSRSERIYIATKCGRKIQPHINANYQPEVLRKFVEDSLKNINVDCIDLIQLHCPPAEVFYRPEIFELFDKLKREGKILNLGVSVEKVEEAIKAIEYPNVTTVQIIFNMLRHKPAELIFREAHKKDIGIIARVPLASGLLTGKFSKDSIFSEKDHRNFNRDGSSFDQGETFSGIDFEKGLAFVEALRKILPPNVNLSNLALKWILMFDEVSCIIPGASTSEQFKSNLETLAFPQLTTSQMVAIKGLYEKYAKESIHHKW